MVTPSPTRGQSEYGCPLLFLFYLTRYNSGVIIGYQIEKGNKQPRFKKEIEMKTKHAPTPLIESLKWYENGLRTNKGRGRISGNSAKLLKLGLLNLRHTSHYDWVLNISNKGKQALVKAGE